MVCCGRWLRALYGIGLLAGLAGAAPPAAAEALSRHQRELLLAQLEDLQARLAAAAGPAALADQAVAVELLKDAEARGWAGAVLERAPVRLRGQAGVTWGQRWVAGPGRRSALRVSLWRLRPDP